MLVILRNPEGMTKDLYQKAPAVAGAFSCNPQAFSFEEKVDRAASRMRCHELRMRIHPLFAFFTMQSTGAL